jgi:hypothetical protein
MTMVGIAMSIKNRHSTQAGSILSIPVEYQTRSACQKPALTCGFVVGLAGFEPTTS